MIISTTENIQGKQVKEVLGLVKGNVIQAKHLGKDVIAGFRQLVGEEIKEYTEMLSEAREVALKRMTDKAKEKKADGVISVRFVTSMVMSGAAEILAYGTAVKFK